MSIMSSIEQARWFVREKKHKAKEEAEGEQKKSSIPGQGQHLQRLRSATNAKALALHAGQPIHFEVWFYALLGCI